jgi:hypothetical protein
MSAIIAGLVIGVAVAITYGVTRNAGRRVAWISMLVVGGILAFVLKGCIFG